MKKIAIALAMAGLLIGGVAQAGGPGKEKTVKHKANGTTVTKKETKDANGNVTIKKHKSL